MVYPTYDWILNVKAEIRLDTSFTPQVRVVYVKYVKLVFQFLRLRVESWYTSIHACTSHNRRASLILHSLYPLISRGSKILNFFILFVWRSLPD